MHNLNAKIRKGSESQLPPTTVYFPYLHGRNQSLIEKNYTATQNFLGPLLSDINRKMTKYRINQHNSILCLNKIPRNIIERAYQLKIDDNDDYKCRTTNIAIISKRRVKSTTRAMSNERNNPVSINEEPYKDTNINQKFKQKLLYISSFHMAKGRKAITNTVRPVIKKNYSKISRFRKYKVKFNASLCESHFNDDAIDGLQRELYQSRYTIYINNHNILNAMKSFLAQSQSMLSKPDVDTILNLIKEYQQAIENEEIKKYINQTLLTVTYR